MPTLVSHHVWLAGQLFRGSTCGKGSKAFLYPKNGLYIYEGSSWTQRHGKNKQHYVTSGFSIRLFIFLILSRVHQEPRLYGSSPTLDTAIGFPMQGIGLSCLGQGSEQSLNTDIPTLIMDGILRYCP
ncbi:hypothetical protein VNO77_19247 [Canavalia gladiata]|uniref:Uncharacterized protein n=1 Tax=Canavalia gladiata TaxID=3824 RepID=A0AAN9LMF0_CANGL